MEAVSEVSPSVLFVAVASVPSVPFVFAYGYKLLPILYRDASPTNIPEVFKKRGNR